MSDRQPTNAYRMAVHSICDGFKMLWRDLAQDELQRRIERLQELVTTRTDADPAELSRHVKVKVLRGGAERGGSLVAVQVTGPAAQVFGSLPWSWAFSISQVHFKTFADEVYQGATSGFADAMFRSEGISQLSFFSARKENNRPKDGGSKGTRVGSRKSDVHTIVYKRARQRCGIETRVQDKTLTRVVNEVEQLTGGFADDVSDAQKMGGLHRRAAVLGFSRFINEVNRRGVRLTDYFSDVCRFPEGAFMESDLNHLNPMEEADIVAPE